MVVLEVILVRFSLIEVVELGVLDDEVETLNTKNSIEIIKARTTNSAPIIVREENLPGSKLK